jgi:aspartate dehydrogenase
MGRQVFSVLADVGRTEVEIVGFLETPTRVAEAQNAFGEAFPVFERIEDLLARDPEIVAECAGHSAVAQYGEAVLNAGKRFLIISIGALADARLFDRLRAAACVGGGQILLPAGALAGLDGIAAARLAGLSRVSLTSAKPPVAWQGTSAQDAVDLANLTEANTFFSGSAREAAQQYPKNANVAAAVALAGLGFEETKVFLVADPKAEGNIHRIVAEGVFRALEIEMRGRALPDNPKTSLLGGLSVARALINSASTFAI